MKKQLTAAEIAKLTAKLHKIENTAWEAVNLKGCGIFTKRVQDLRSRWCDVAEQLFPDMYGEARNEHGTYNFGDCLA